MLIRKFAALKLLTLCIYLCVIKGNLMIKKIAFVLAFFVSFSGISLADSTTETNTNINDGRNDVIEAWGGTRNGGEC
jgi:hypothetical protein